MSQSFKNSQPIELEFDVEVPSESMVDKFEKWDEIHTVDHLSDMSIRDIESERLKFESKVKMFKSRYRRGRSVNAAMAKIAGKEPYTHEQLREARQFIKDEADRIRPRFKRAKGIKKEERRKSWRGFLANLADCIEITILRM